MGPHYVDFTSAFDITLIGLEMNEICAEYVAQTFLPPPPGIVSSEPPWDRVKTPNDLLGVVVFS